MGKIVLAGGSGNIGKMLAQSFLERGDQVYILSRSNRRSAQKNLLYVQWSGEALGSWTEVLKGADVLINLSGESIQKRLTKRNRILLEESRLKPTRALGRAVASISHPPKLWINFSGVSLFEGIDGIHTEDSETYANTFLAQLVKKWEAAFWNADTPQTTKVVLRLSPVLQRSAGMFAELYPLVKMGLGGTVGEGSQCVSWVHERDLLHMVHWIIERAAPSSVYHACSPYPTTNKEFMRLFRKEAGVTFGLRLPAAIAKVGAFFKGVDESFLFESVSVVSKRFSEQGFRFEYANLTEAFRELVSRPK